MSKDTGAPEPRNEPKTDPHPTRRALGVVEPERSQPHEEDEGIEIDNAIERRRTVNLGSQAAKLN